MPVLTKRLLLVSSLMLAGCSGSISQPQTSTLESCLPDAYQRVALDIPATPDPNFDPDDNLLDVRLLIPASHLEKAIAGYKPIVTRAGQSRHQGIYLTVVKYRQPQFDREGGLSPVNQHEALLRVGSDDFQWHVLEKRRVGNDVIWGRCTTDFRGGFDCLRTLSVDQHALVYPVDQDNLHLFEDIDRLLKATVAPCLAGEPGI